MKKSVKYLSLLIIVLFVLFIALKINAENLSFVLALNQIVNSMISEIWKFVSNPTIFIVIVILIILTQNKQLILDQLLKRVKKVKGFGVEAELTEILENQIGKAITMKPRTEILPGDKTELFKLIIQNLTQDWCRFFLEINEQLINKDTLPEFFSVIEWENIIDGMKIDVQGFKSGYLLGSIKLLMSLKGVIYNITEASEDSFKFSFDSEFIELLKKSNFESKKKPFYDN